VCFIWTSHRYLKFPQAEISEIAHDFDWPDGQLGNPATWRLLCGRSLRPDGGHQESKLQLNWFRADVAMTALLGGH
jgi:hypothetical protein